MNWKELATLKNAHAKRLELIEFQKQLKENPLQEHEYRSLIEESNLEPKDKINYYNHIKGLKKADMLIDDIPETFEDFSSRMEKNGIVPIKSSVMKQMSKDEFTQLTSKRFQPFDDTGGIKSHVTHYEYRSKRGLIEKTGEGISVRHIKTDNIDDINNAHKRYQSAKKEIGKTLAEIEINGHKYENFRVDKP